MNVGRLFFLILYLTGVSVSGHADMSVPEDYCYKPKKPLFFSTQHYKNRYNEDIKEYERCQKNFIEMQQDVLEMQTESEKNAQKIWEKFVKQR